MKKEKLFGVPLAGLKDTTRMNSKQWRSAWKHDYQTIFHQED
jgi:hypothetical protein